MSDVTHSPEDVRGCPCCEHAQHDGECDAIVGYDHLNGDHDCGCGGAPEKDAIGIWPPEEWCAQVNPHFTHICDQPKGHSGSHSGPEMPTVILDEHS